MVKSISANPAKKTGLEREIQLFLGFSTYFTDIVVCVCVFWGKKMCVHSVENLCIGIVENYCGMKKKKKIALKASKKERRMFG